MQDVSQTSARRREESIQDLLGDKYAQWQAYQMKRAQVQRIQLLELGEKTVERMRQSLARPPGVTADRSQLAAPRQLREVMERMAADNQRTRMELEREGLLTPRPQQ